jgi:SAM-dependent methyltransferase
MLGERLDYYVLRAFAHERLKATEAALDARHASGALDEREAYAHKLRKLERRFDGHLRAEPGLRYLDMGCGTGELSIALAKRGAGHVTGIDFMPRTIEAARLNAQREAVDGRVDFVCADLHAWTPAQKYDVLLSFDVLEHVRAPRAFLRRMAEFARPGGRALLAFGPLFHSPFGDHMGEFFRVPMPWRGVLFNEQALLRVRRECYRPTDPATRLPEIAGGLNCMRYSEFLADLAATGWTPRFLRANAMLEGPLRALSDVLTRTPRVRDYVVHNVYAVLERKSGSEPDFCKIAQGDLRKIA